MLNRDPKNVIMLDLKRFPTLQPDNLVEVPEWTGKEPSDTWLLDVIPFLELLAYSEDVRQVLPNYHGKDIPTAVLQSVREQEQKAAAEAERVAEERRKAAEKLASGGGWIGKVMSWIGDAVGVSPASVAAVVCRMSNARYTDMSHYAKHVSSATGTACTHF